MIARILRALVVIELLIAAGVAGWLALGRDWAAVPALLAGLAVPLGVHASIVAINFGLAATARSPTPPEHRLGGPLAAIGVYMREVTDSVRVFQWAQPWLAGHALPGEESGGTAPDAPMPVVLVHGYLCNRQLWRPFARWLARRGHAVRGVDLEPVFGSIDGYAPIVAQAVEELRARCGAPRVALVCHSMGGLAARAYLRANPDAPVACVVTLGTPHRGTVHARLGQGENAAQMRPDSDWLKALADSESAESLGRFTVVFSHHDNIVAPQTVQTLPGARTVAFSGVGHLSLAFDPRVWSVVAQAVAGALPGGARADA